MVQFIAELCQNHRGEPDLVWRMLDAAVESGATHVKLQSIYADELTFRPQFEDGLQRNGRVESIKRPFSQEYERLKGLELEEEVYVEFVKRATDAAVVPMTTCFTRSQIPRIRDQGFKTIKVASYDCASFQLLRELAQSFAHLYISTGATYDDEVERAAQILEDHDDVSFLHCITIYPTPLDQLHLARMQWLRQFRPLVGFSDHTLVGRDGLIASKSAIALGADIVERHFTVLPPDSTKDGPVSVTPSQLRELVDFADMPREEQVAELASQGVHLELLAGERQRTLSPEELLNRDYYRGRFGSPRVGSSRPHEVIYNWEEVGMWQ